KQLRDGMSPTARTETMLIVDDEPLVLSLATAMLTRFGNNTITAFDGKAVLRLFEKWPKVAVDLALVNLVMPGLNGVQTCRRNSASTGRADKRSDVMRPGLWHRREIMEPIPLLV